MHWSKFQSINEGGVRNDTNPSCSVGKAKMTGNTDASQFECTHALPGMTPNSTSKGFDIFEVTRTIGDCKWSRTYHHDHDAPNNKFRRETRRSGNNVTDIRVFETGKRTYPWTAA